MFQDPRLFQIAFLSAFLGLGVWTRDWTLQPYVVLTAIAVCAIAQVLLVLLLPPPSQQPSVEKKQGSQWHYALTSLPSAAITSLSLCLLLRTNQPITMAVAAVAAISSKFLLRSPHRKHFFNPANFGIIVVLLLTQDAWVSPGQWGTDWWAVLLLAGTGGTICGRVGRWDTSATFLGGYTVLELLRHLWLGWAGWDLLLHHLSSGSLLLFALFMLTDPRSIPNARLARVLWALAIAVLTFGLRYVFFIPAAMFWALFLLAPTTVLFDRIWPAQPFQWIQPSTQSSAEVTLATLRQS